MINFPVTRRIRHLRRYRYILNVLVRHGFGFALNLLPAERKWLRKLQPSPPYEPQSLPVHFRLALEELGPTFVKLGQMLSTRPDILPPSYITELARLQDAVPPIPWEEIKSVIGRELNATPDKGFRHIDPTPLAAASLGQVHAAVLNNGDQVVIKVQRPNILKTINTDLEILQEMARYAQRYTPLGNIYSLEEIAEDFSYTLHAELDYRREAHNAEQFRENFINEPGIYIPKVYWAYTTKRVLTLECIEGIKVDDIPAITRAGHDPKQVAKQGAQFIIKQVLEDGFFHADPHPGNLIVMENGDIGAMDFGMVGHLSDQDRTNLIRIYTVAVQMDAEAAVDELVHIGAAPPDVDRQSLVRDVDNLLHRYYGIALQDVSAAKFINDIRPMVFKHRLKLPTNYWTLGKSLSMMESIGRQLDPEFDIFAFSRPYVTKLVLGLFFPSRQRIQSLAHTSLLWSDLIQALPRTGLRLMERLDKQEPVTLAFDRRNLDRLDKLVTRLALSLMIAGMTISLALVISSISNTGNLLYAILILGFMIALGLGAWLMISILRK